MKTKLLLPFAFIAFIFASCVKDKEVKEIRNYSPEEYTVLAKTLTLPEQTFNYQLSQPHMSNGIFIMPNDHQATLGRVLFYDKRLSDNNTVSCASCHKPEFAFADNVAFSQGAAIGERTSRNSLALATFQSFESHYNGFSGARLFWDERANDVIDQSKQTLLNPVEMGVHDIPALAEKLLQQDYYRVLFQKAFPGTESGNNLSNENKMLVALQAFVRSISSSNSRFDQALAPNVNFTNFTMNERMGKNLFDTHCENCHALQGQSVLSANNGLDMDYQDKGVFEVTQNPADDGVFKVPSLRNVALTAPYMHDGRFATLEEVVEHYSAGVKDHPNLHPNLKMGNLPRNLNLSAQDKEALIAFLHTLTDNVTFTAEKFLNPFK